LKIKYIFYIYVILLVSLDCLFLKNKSVHYGIIVCHKNVVYVSYIGCVRYYKVMTE